jgi:hypothetical protein
MGILELLFKRITFSEGRLTNHDLNQVRESWMKVEEQLSLGKPSNFNQAVMTADKTVDYVLKAIYPRTSTMGERLKAAREKFRSDPQVYEDLWYAHKIRNELAHNLDFHLPSFEAKNVVEKFKVALRVLRAL